MLKETSECIMWRQFLIRAYWRIKLTNGEICNHFLAVIGLQLSITNQELPSGGGGEAGLLLNRS